MQRVMVLPLGTRQSSSTRGVSFPPLLLSMHWVCALRTGSGCVLRQTSRHGHPGTPQPPTRFRHIHLPHSRPVVAGLLIAQLVDGPTRQLQQHRGRDCGA
jgi:hypothetical protein